MPARQNLAHQGEKALNFIKTIIKKRYMEPKKLLEVFDRMVTPILCYGADIWGYEICDSIEKVHVKWCKYILGVSSTTPTPAVLGELGRVPLYVIHTMKCIKFWCKIIEMSSERLPKSCYRVLYNL